MREGAAWGDGGRIMGVGKGVERVQPKKIAQAWRGGWGVEGGEGVKRHFFCGKSFRHLGRVTTPAEKPSPLSTEIPELEGGIDAETEYRRLVVELVKLGHLTTLSRQNLVNYCEAYAIARDALHQMRTDGAVIENDEKGTKYMHPAFGVWSASTKVMDLEARNLGMTPKSLEEIKNPPKSPNAKKKPGPSAFFSREQKDD